MPTDSPRRIAARDEHKSSLHRKGRLQGRSHLAGGSVLIALLCTLISQPAIARGKAEHVVLVVWDGMRPDFVTREYAPNLSKLGEAGVRFRNHHSIYPSLTSVNAAALATGVYPNRSGMIANWVFRPELNGGKLARLDAPNTIQKGEALTGGKYLAAATIAQLVRANGGRTAVVGTKTASLLHDRSEAERNNSVTLFDGRTIPASALATLTKSLGQFPEADEIPNTAQDAWTTRALTEVLWADGVPEFSLLWMSDPDRSQHATSPGVKESLAGIKSADANLGLLLTALERKGVRDKTDVLIASDHGFSTIDRAIDVRGLLRKSGFDLAGEEDIALKRGQVRVAGNGGTNLYYIGEHDRETGARLIELLQQSDFTSVIFSRHDLPGTFPLAQVHLDIDPGPDVVMAFRWDDRRNANGVAGMIDSNGTGDENKGTHGTLSRFDLHNTFIAAGPDFRRGMETDLPTSNLDVAATIMNILDLTPPQPLDGRVVSEAMNGNAKSPRMETKKIETSREFASATWRQELTTTKLGSSIYIDEGRGRFEAK